MNTQETTQRHDAFSLLVVDKHNSDEHGQFTTCSLLEHILKLNDRSILKRLGKLDYNSLSNYDYHLDITGKAFLDEQVVFTSFVTALAENMLKIEVLVEKMLGNRLSVIARGSFMFLHA